MSKIFITSPVGRIVMGSLYTANTKDADGKQLVFKTGPNAGQGGRVNYFIALAIPKGVEQHWSQTSWGQQILQVGAQHFPQMYQHRDFSWKIQDGDDTQPNKKGRKNSETEGFPGHWVLSLSNGFAPKIFREENGQLVQALEPDFVKCGHWVEVNFGVDKNTSSQNPGVYLNLGTVCFRGYGPEIVSGPDVNAMGFGKTPLPTGVSTIPLASTTPLPQLQTGTIAPNNMPFPATSQVAQGIPVIPGVQPRPEFLNPHQSVLGVGHVAQPSGLGVPAAQPIPNQTYAPNAANIQNQSTQAYAPPVTMTSHSSPLGNSHASNAAAPLAHGIQPTTNGFATTASGSRQMTAAAQAPYDVYIKSGWTDQQLIANGLMVP